jgi:hypothetical protein
MRTARSLARLGFLPLLLLGAACSKGGGGGSSPTGSDPTIPTIANLRVALGQSCTISGTGIAGTAKSVAVDYADADGNLRGGTLELTLIADVGGTQPQTAAIPSGPVTISGTTSGTITVTSCLHFGSNSSITQQVRVADATGKVSNTLATKVTNPGLLLQPSGPDAAPSERLQHADRALWPLGGRERRRCQGAAHGCLPDELA